MHDVEKEIKPRRKGAFINTPKFQLTEGRHTQVYPLKHVVRLHKARLAHSESREMGGTGKTPTTTRVYDYDACADLRHISVAVITSIM